MPVITVGRLAEEQARPNQNGERWVRGTIRLHGPCQRLLTEIGQRKLPFTYVTDRLLPKQPVIILGDYEGYRIPDTGRIWKTLSIQKIILPDGPVLEKLGITFPEAVRKIARKDSSLLEALGKSELDVRKKLTDLVGTKNKFADRILELYGDMAYEKVVENPWKLIHLVPYFTIQQADKVAEKLGIPLTDGRRFQEYFRYLLDQSFEGHRNTYIQEHEFIAFYWMHFSGDMPLEEFKQLAGKRNSPIIKSELGYHPAHFYRAEKASYEVVLKSLDIRIPVTHTEQAVLEDVISHSDIQLTGEQGHAAVHAFHSPLHIITGGPGTGKTTILKTILQKMFRMVQDPFGELSPILLAAPTGKAAFRMWEQTGVTAHTIHSAFGIIPDYGCLNVEEMAKRLSHVRYLVIDEASMLDTKLFGDLCRILLAMDHVPFLLLVGDIDQLPPVQHGQVFRDLLEFLKERAPDQVTELTVLKRQGADSYIPELAAYIRNGQFPGQGWFEGKPDIFFAPVSMDNFQAVLKEGVLGPKQGELDTIQILTPYRNGETPDTIHAINHFVQGLYNPVPEDAPGVTVGNPPRTFHVGDKVINRTNRTKTIINGSIGTVRSIYDQPRDLFAWTMEVDFDGEIETFEYEEFKSLELAYAITIHASQGSEYENVVTCITRGSHNPEFLNRNLLYVAVTRASKRLVLLGQISTFQQMAATEQKPRKTALSHWLGHYRAEKGGGQI